MDTVTIRRDGLLGLGAMDNRISAHRLHVVSSGLAYKISRLHLMQESQSNPVVYKMCTQAGVQIIRKVLIEVACARFHTIDQRMAKWLLIRLDASGSPIIHARHQDIADSLGVRREAITLTVSRLQGISHGRNEIFVDDALLLKKHCCECYENQLSTFTPQMMLSF